MFENLIKFRRRLLLHLHVNLNSNEDDDNENLELLPIEQHISKTNIDMVPLLFDPLT